mmetsp:Transcript_44182/g.126087  ORF Transcript_44182/g.126087 Transcript_44182/m.126087 type:complete len:250 (+) Transcript_44182:1126-1875(+)
MPELTVVAQGYVQQVVAQMRGERVRGAPQRVLVEGPGQAGDQVGVGPHGQHGAPCHVGHLADNVSAALAQAHAYAVLAGKGGAVLVAAAVAHVAGERLEAGKLGLVDGLVRARANRDGIIEALVNGLAGLVLDHHVPLAWRTGHGQHRGPEGYVPQEVKPGGVLLQVLLVLRVVPVEAMARRWHVREGHQVVADCQDCIIIDPILVRAIKENTALFALFVKTLDKRDPLILQLLDCGQSSRTRTNDADP